MFGDIHDDRRHWRLSPGNLDFFRGNAPLWRLSFFVQTERHNTRRQSIERSDLDSVEKYYSICLDIM